MITLQLTDKALNIPPLIRLLRDFQRLKWRILCLVKGQADDAKSLEQEFNALVERENNTISKICFSYAGSVSDYEDLRQDALINIWRGLKSFRGEAKQRTWVYRITVNSCLSTIRRSARHDHQSLDGLYHLIEAPEDDKEQIEQLYMVISCLGPQDRAIIMMWLDEMKYDDIASVMGMNRNTVATRLSRIKEKIIEQYKKEETL